MNAKLTSAQYKRIYNIEGFLDYPVHDMEDLFRLLPKKIKDKKTEFILHLSPFDVFYINPKNGKIRFIIKIKNENYIDALISMLELLSENYFI